MWNKIKALIALWCFFFWNFFAFPSFFSLLRGGGAKLIKNDVLCVFLLLFFLVEIFSPPPPLCFSVCYILYHFLRESRNLQYIPLSSEKRILIAYTHRHIIYKTLSTHHVRRPKIFSNTSMQETQRRWRPGKEMSSFSLTYWSMPGMTLKLLWQIQELLWY